MPTGYVSTRYVENDESGNPVTHERGDKVEVGAAEYETLKTWGILQDDPVENATTTPGAPPQ